MSLSEKLIIAAKNGSTREVRKLLGRGALFTKDQFGNTALHEAAWNGNNDIVKILLNSYCFVDSINYSGFTPLHLASQNGHAKVAKTLLKWKADPSLLNQHGETAIHLVAKYNHSNVIAAFASFKVNVNIGGKDGNTPLHIAAKLGNIETLKALLSAGANPIIINDKGMRPVDYAESSGTKEAVKVLHSAALKLKSKQQRSLTSLSSQRPAAGKTMSTIDGRTLTSADSDSSPQARPRMIRASSTSGKLQVSSSTEDFPHKLKNKKNSVILDHRMKMSESVPSHSFYGFSASQDVPLFVGPSDTYVYHQPPQNSSNSKCASIDQLLNEIEREYSGVEQRLQSTKENTDSRKGRGISPYAEFHQLVGDCVSKSQPDTVGVKQMRPPLPSKPYYRSTSDGKINRINYEFLHSASESPLDSYDYLRPPRGESQSASQSPQPQNGRGHDGPQTTVLSGSPRDRRSSSMDHLCASPSGLKHRRIYEELSPRDADDGDTYVYMAPLKDFPEAAAQQQQEQAALNSPSKANISSVTDGSGSTALDSSSELSVQADSISTTSETSTGPAAANGKVGGKAKKAVICDSAFETEPVHEPNTSLEPPKGILSQPAESELEKSVLERYLQEELETMRTAFQIRLSQIEKRYQRQLVLEQQKNRQSPLLVRNPLVPPQQKNQNTRRNSWHSCIPGNEDLDGLVIPEVRSGSSQGFDSDFSVEGSDVESDIVPVNRIARKKKAVQFTCGSPDVYEHDSSPGPADNSVRGHHTVSKLSHTIQSKSKEGLKGGNGSWARGEGSQESPRLSPLAEIDDKTILSEEAQGVIQKKIKEYRQKMGKYFQEKSEAQIAVIEKEYLVHMNEYRRQCSEREEEKVSHLENRIKDLENLLEVQTLV